MSALTMIIGMALGLLTGITVATAVNERDRRERRHWWVISATTALATLVVAFIPVLPYLIL